MSASNVGADVEIFGLLVKSWATGLDYLTAPYNRQPPSPANLIPPKAGWNLPALQAVSVVKTDGGTIQIKAVAMDLQEFKQILEAAGKVSNVIGEVTKATHVVIVQDDPDALQQDDTVIIRLPPKKLLKQSEGKLKDSDYTIPDFYSELYRDPDNTGNGAKQMLPKTDPGKMKLHANRIGDYSMALCQ